MIITPLTQDQTDAMAAIQDRREAALFMPLGTGKSLVALALADRAKAKRVLITSDKINTAVTWPEEIWKHTDFNCYIRPTHKELTQCVRGVGTQCVCVNYDLLSSRWEDYNKVEWDMWIGDESSMLKDQRTQRFKNVYHVVRNITRRVILNGKPVSERPEDIFGQFFMLDDGKRLGRSITAFHSRYMQPAPSGYGWVLQRSAITRIQKATQDIAYWLLNPKTKLPKPSHFVYRLRGDPTTLTLDKKLEQDFGAVLKGGEIEVNYAASVFIKRHQLSGGTFKPTDESPDQAVPCAKLPLVARLVMDNSGVKIIVWHQYIAETTWLWEALTLVGVDPLFRYESIEDKDQLDRFEKSEHGVLLIRNSMAKGLNKLAGAQVAIFYSNPLSYQTRCQAEGRSCRLNSPSDQALYVDIVTRGMVDSHVYHLLQNKQSLALTFSSLRGTLDASKVESYQS